MRYFSKSLASTGALFLALLGLPAGAATLTVTSTSDAGAGSLRDRIASAAVGDTIVFAPGVTGTISLASTLAVSQDLTVRGPGAASLTISGSNAVRVFSISGGNFTLSAVTIANGTVAAGLGGGIDITGGAVNLRDSVLQGNSATNGGGIAVGNGSTLTATGSTFANNTTTSVGGGAIIVAGSATLTGNTLTGNSAPVNGGAINVQPAGVLNAVNNTFRANTSGALGGALSNLGTTNLVNNTFSANVASSGAVIATGNANATLHNNVFADNSATTSPSALYGAFTTSSNNVFFNNRAAGLEDDQTGQGTVNFVYTTTQPLAPLANNGGPTQTMLPVQGAAAICAGSIALLPGGITQDQRGLPRVSGSCIDAGSVQLLGLGIPALSTWMMILLASLLVMTAMGQRRRQTPD